MLKKFGLGLVFVGALMFGVCTVNTVFVDSGMAASHEAGEKVDVTQVPTGAFPVFCKKPLTLSPQPAIMYP